MRKLFGIFLTMGILIWASTAGAITYDISVTTTSQISADTIFVGGSAMDLGTLSFDFSYDCDSWNADTPPHIDPLTGVVMTWNGSLTTDSVTVDTGRLTSGQDGPGYDTVVWHANNVDWGGGETYAYDLLVYVPQGFDPRDPMNTCGEICEFEAGPNSRINVFDPATKTYVVQNLKVAGTGACAPIPEPSTLLLLGGGLAGLAGMSWRRRKNG